MQILLVEDDVLLADGISAALKHAGYTVNHFFQGAHALHAYQINPPDIIILDLGLPDMDGLSLLTKIRNQEYKVPILILTARDGIQDKITGLDKGADDYLTKPFNVEELLARLRVLERRRTHNATATITIGPVCLNTSAHTVTVEQELLNLSRREYMLLKALIERCGTIQTKENLEHKLYSWGEEISSNTIEVHIHNLRKKLPPDFIHTVRGMGYMIKKV